MSKPRYEIPPAEQLARAVYSEDHLDAKAGGAKRLRRLDSDALDTALMGRLLSIDQHTTLERFRGDLYRAGLVFCPRAGFEVSGVSGQGQFLADSAFHRARRVGDQMKALTEAIPAPALATVLASLTMDEPVTKATAPALHQAVVVLDALTDR